ncbi:DUF3526 domain-containing protein [Roseivirga thermotolerans]|uniref:ABC-2 type transporter transmembrane domain-containing protein n=1 Tax=Roseivirga thermotolerans TaxID=1758176 RepID=A0ABQ3I5K4_9BACT|nr:DUF3526 domain-containing protein [Roseivirga thermotolerans]GHE56252.1 hypothetical protein GCM10011340_08940 [Roseivirga thermotolerans]
MVFLVAAKEIKEIVRSGQFKWMLGIVVLLSMVATYISHVHWQEKNRQRIEAANQARELWLAQGSTNPHNAAHYGTFAFKPQFPLALIDPGVEKYTGVSIFLEAHSRNEADHVAAADQTGLSRFGDLTPDFVLLFIVPLMIIALGHQSVTKEKEQGTLKIIKTQGISNRQLIAGKWLGNYLPVAMLTTCLFVVAALFIGEFDWKFLATLWLVYLAYFAIVNSITLVVSSLTNSSGISLVTLLAIWICSCLAVPKIASSYTNEKHPYPTRQEFEAAIAEDKKKGLDGHDPWSEASKKLERETLEAYQVNKLEDLPFNFDAFRMQKGEEHEAEIYFKHNERLKEVHKEQTTVYQKLAVLSPFLPTRFMSMSLAHTDYSTHWHFADEAEKHRIKMQEILNTNFAENSRLGEWGYKADASLLSEIPEFHFEALDFNEVMSANSSNLGILTAWLLASFGLLIFASTRI